MTQGGSTATSLRSQALRFLVFGIVAAAVDYGLLLVLTNLVGLAQWQGKAISFVFGTITAYALNARYTFAARHRWGHFAVVMGTYAVMFAVQVGLYTLLFHLLDGRLAHVVVQTGCFVVAQGVATVVNFFVQRAVFADRSGA